MSETACRTETIFWCCHPKEKCDFFKDIKESMNVCIHRPHSGSVIHMKCDNLEAQKQVLSRRGEVAELEELRTANTALKQQLREMCEAVEYGYFFLSIIECPFWKPGTMELLNKYLEQSRTILKGLDDD